MLKGDDAGGGWSGPARVLGIALALAVALILLAVWLAARNGGVQEHVVTCFAGEGVVTCDLPGSDESVTWRGVVRWYDREGTEREHIRPGCLPKGKRSERVRIGVVDVEHEGSGWKSVVWVDCRG